MKNYISINMISQALLLIKDIIKNSCYRRSEIQQLKLPYGININSSVAFAIQCGWLIDNGEVLVFSDIGKEIELHFNGESIDIELWKKILLSYITACHPAWASRIPYGRKEAFLFMNEEEQRCFLEAGLMDRYDDSVLRWWDSIAESERLKASAIFDDIGRTGEKLTVQYEEERTGVKPDWRSVETNLSGYDILSQFSKEDTRHLLIEVKSSTKPLDSAEAVISRHEWDVACLDNNTMRYFFYFWLLGETTKRLAIVDVETMRQHIPQDKGAGKWTEVAIPFIDFASRFSEWILN